VARLRFPLEGSKDKIPLLEEITMNSMTQKMGSDKSGQVEKGNAEVPKEGDRFRCQTCGMEIEVTTACRCSDPNHVEFQCCGQEMAKV
jgi:hypothetical protein